MRDAERGREDLRGILSDRIKLEPDASGTFLWADYGLGLRALLPKNSNAEIMVARARYAQLLRRGRRRCVFADVVIRHRRPSRGPEA